MNTTKTHIMWEIFSNLLDARDVLIKILQEDNLGFVDSDKTHYCMSGSEYCINSYNNNPIFIKSRTDPYLYSLRTFLYEKVKEINTALQDELNIDESELDDLHDIEIDEKLKPRDLSEIKLSDKIRDFVLFTKLIDSEKTKIAYLRNTLNFDLNQMHFYISAVDLEYINTEVKRWLIETVGKLETSIEETLAKKEKK